MLGPVTPFRSMQQHALAKFTRQHLNTLHPQLDTLLNQQSLSACHSVSHADDQMRTRTHTCVHTHIYFCPLSYMLKLQVNFSFHLFVFTVFQCDMISFNVF